MTYANIWGRNVILKRKKGGIKGKQRRMMINWRSMMGLQVWRGLGIFVNFVERFRLFQLHGWPEGCEHVEGDVPDIASIPGLLIIVTNVFIF